MPSQCHRFSIPFHDPANRATAGDSWFKFVKAYPALPGGSLAIQRVRACGQQARLRATDFRLARSEDAATLLTLRLRPRIIDGSPSTRLDRMRVQDVRSQAIRGVLLLPIVASKVKFRGNAQVLVSQVGYCRNFLCDLKHLRFRLWDFSALKRGHAVGFRSDQKAYNCRFVFR